MTALRRKSAWLCRYLVLTRHLVARRARHLACVIIIIIAGLGGLGFAYAHVSGADASGGGSGCAALAPPTRAHSAQRPGGEVGLVVTDLLATEAQRLCDWEQLSYGSGRIRAWGPFGLGGLLALLGGMLLSLPRVRARFGGMANQAAAGDAARRLDDGRPGLPPDEAWLRSGFEQSADGMMLVRVDTDGRFIYAAINEAWQRVCDQSAADSIGRTPHDVWPPAVADATVERFRRCVASGRPLHYEKADHVTGGRDLRIMMTPLRAPAGYDGEDGRIAMLLCQARDMTEEVQLEARLQHERRMETIRRLAAGVAHDFNNILQAICGGLELILDEAGPQPQQDEAPISELATIALNAAQRGSHLTQHLLAYARRQVLVPQPVDLGKFLPQLRPALEQALGPGNRLELVIGGDGATVFVDEANLRTALLNLAFNAAAAMPHGGRLRIETESLDNADGFGADGFGACVRITVSDTGSGMDAATLARCPEPFFTTKGATGTGLGLSMVQGFAIQSGGALRLSSRLGHGTTAVLTLPACSSEPVAMPVRTPGRAGRILLADDATDVLLTTGRMLERAGLEVTPVRSGDAALAVLASGQVFDALVTDFAMPGLSGVELIRLAREMQYGLPALIITGLYEVDISRLQQTAHVLRKPFHRQDLLNALQDLMGAAAGAEAGT